MKRLSSCSVLVVGLLAILSVSKVSATTILADTVLDFYDSGVGAMAGPYGGVNPGAYPVSVPLTHATDGNATTFVSLPTGSYLTLGFSSGFVFDGVGLDLFVSEVGGGSEHAQVWISSDLGSSFTFLGIATTATVSGFDFASIGYTGFVNAVKIIGIDNGGASPGFDLAYVEGLEGSVVSTVPDTFATAGLLGLSFMLLTAFRKNRR